MLKRAPAPPAILHPIQIVTRRTGVSADVLRVWEKRYAVVTPVRSPSGRRLYSDADIERLRLLVQATRTGRPIGQVATLPTPAILTLLEEEAPTPRPPRHRRQADIPLVASPTADDVVEGCLEAIGDFDALALDLQLRRAIVALSADDFLDAVVVPLVDHLRIRVLDGSLRRPHGHLAHAVLRRVLDDVVATATAPLHSRDLVVAPLGAHAHELDALIVAAAAAADGWRVTYVGAGVPAEDVAEMVQLLGARVLVLSQAASSGDRVIPRELRRLRALLPARIELLVVATTADVQRAALAETGATPIVGLGMLRTRLRALSGDASAKNGTTDRASRRPRIRARR
ncbi:MAG: MerR family transcriptional regulator [Gemmatimonadetes bacterium]|nr:MerR family transcriptional regulator [Gemmatimonadota bacterium]